MRGGVAAGPCCNGLCKARLLLQGQRWFACTWGRKSRYVICTGRLGGLVRVGECGERRNTGNTRRLRTKAQWWESLGSMGSSGGGSSAADRGWRCMVVCGRSGRVCGALDGGVACRRQPCNASSGARDWANREVRQDNSWLLSHGIIVVELADLLRQEIGNELAHQISQFCIKYLGVLGCHGGEQLRPMTRTNGQRVLLCWAVVNRGRESAHVAGQRGMQHDIIAQCTSAQTQAGTGCMHGAVQAHGTQHGSEGACCVCVRVCRQASASRL